MNYTGPQLIAVVNALAGVDGGFSIGIDVNNTNDPQTLESFFLLDLTDKVVVASFLPGLTDASPSSGTGPTGRALPNSRSTGAVDRSGLDHPQPGYGNSGAVDES